MDKWNSGLQLTQVAHLDDQSRVGRVEAATFYAPAVVDVPGAISKGAHNVELWKRIASTPWARIPRYEFKLFSDSICKCVLVAFKDFQDLVLVHLFEEAHQLLVLHNQGARQHGVPQLN